MVIVATQKNTRQTPRKMRLVANTVRKMPLVDALQQLAIIERRATIGVLKVVQQAIANAVNNHGYKFEDLTLKNILVTEGARLKRFRAVSRGRGHGVLKRTSHVRVELEAGAPAAAKPIETPKEIVAVEPKEEKKTAEVQQKSAKKTEKPTKKTSVSKASGKSRSASEKSKKV